MTKKKSTESEASSNIPENILSQKDIDHLLTYVATGAATIFPWHGANTRECVLSNLKSVKTPEGYLKVIMNFVEEREEYRKEAEEHRNEMKEMKDDIAMLVRIFNKTLGNEND